jgi:hypothetical protein
VAGVIVVAEREPESDGPDGDRRAFQVKARVIRPGRSPSPFPGPS